MSPQWKEGGRKCFILQCTQHILFTVIWRRMLKDVTTVEGRRKEMFYLTTHSTHFIYGYVKDVTAVEERRKEMFYLTTH